MSFPADAIPPDLIWPAARLAEAVAALGHRHGWTDAGHTPPPPADVDPDLWLSQAAAHLGLEAEALETDYAGVPGLLAGCAPALLRLPEGGFLALLERRGRRLRLLDAHLRPRRLPLTTIQAVLRRPLEDTLATNLDALTAAAQVAPRRRARAQAALRAELLAHRRLQPGWLLRPAPTASLDRQAREFRVRGLLGVLSASHAVGFLLWLGAWGVLGRGVFSGHLDVGWLQAWALLLLTLWPLRLLTSAVGGLFALRAGALLKRRLLMGALRLDPEEIRPLGVGRLLGGTLEAEALEQLAVSGGFLGLTGLVEAVLAGGILALTPGPGLALAAWSLTGAGFGVAYLRRHRRWTLTRLALTDRLVEGMVGHRTRAVQEPREHWNRHEDPVLARYYQISQDRDRAALHLRVTWPRGGFLVGIAALAPYFATGLETELAIALGGVLAASLALRHLAQGLEQLLAARVAFEQIRPFWQAATRTEILGPPERAARPPAPAEDRPLIEARRLSYRPAQRPEPVLRAASLTLAPRDRVLLEGASGSGKSTLAAILAGQRRPEAGLCLVGGLDFASLGERAWRRRIALVPQFHENHVLMGSLAFNLLLGRNWPPSARDLAEAEALCHALGLGPLLARMPSGLQQPVGETGWQLSHGERERVFLARALLQGAEGVILDESVSSLDPQTLRETVALLWERAPALVLIVHA